MLMRVFVLRDEPHARALRAFLKGNWKELADQGRPLSVTVQEHKAKRTDSQNRLYWQRLNDIAAQAWVGGKQFSAEAWHEFYKAKLIGLEEVPDGRRFGISTTSLSVSEFSDYMERIAAHAATELGIEVSV
jgi:hypothetical protein